MITATRKSLEQLVWKAIEYAPLNHYEYNIFRCTLDTCRYLCHIATDPIPFNYDESVRLDNLLMVFRPEGIEPCDPWWGNMLDINHSNQRWLALAFMLAIAKDYENGTFD